MVVIKSGFGSIVAAAGMMLALGGCQSTTHEEAERIVAATTVFINSSDSGDIAAARSTCFDTPTRGEPLAIFRTMRSIPKSELKRWYRPNRLRISPGRLDAATLADSAGRAGPRLREPEPELPDLSLPMKSLFASTAQRLIHSEPQSVRLASSAVAGATVRWWPRNRLASNCAQTYSLSHVVLDRGVAFIQASNGHWATLYALTRTPQGWHVAGQWDTWLY